MLFDLNFCYINRPTRYCTEHYQSFPNKIVLVLKTSSDLKCEIILTGDLDIIINEKHISNEFLDKNRSPLFPQHCALAFTS